MKQTLEEAAQSISGTHPDWSRLECFRIGFKESAKWQAEQSPWHEVSEEPKKGEHICVQVGSGNLTSWFATSNIRKDFEDYNAIRWAYVSDLIKSR